MSDSLIIRWCAAKDCDVSASVDPQGPHAWGDYFCVAHRGRKSRADIGASVRRALPFATVGAWYGGLPEHGPGAGSWRQRAPRIAADSPTFTPTDRQRRRIAGARAYIAQRLTVAYSGELDTGTVHGPACPSCGGTRTILGVRPYGACVTAEGGPTRYPCPRCSR